ncbi:NUDIX domain-containing protein [Rhizobiales bacterium RZME27]|uniref:NUDIX domain-containing protein n=1 Tax=Endobacterium cereale TaxID=2663029 RepID=A0A6A8A755_9HYPH|nr:NUDIX hydrolase [Endobacterium cereale]MEB2846777.1 NUDIX hydrolase [Endobacterium cereale]MQY46504.1 NUDIX domain-containing protein [Endobacterium cereale]
MSLLVCAVFIDANRALLVKRAHHRKWSQDRWDLVGGHVEKGEGLDVALVRECQEEVGLTPLAFNHVATLFEADDRKRKSPFHIYAVRHWTGGAAKLLGHEHSELGWFLKDELEELELAMPEYRAVIIENLN